MDIADGLGIRVSLFVSGCRNHCKGCFNECTWDFSYGKPFDSATEEKIIELLRPSYIAGFSLLGGDPFEEENQQALAPFLEKIKSVYPKKDIWCWTGYVLESDLFPDYGRRHTEFTNEILRSIDVLVDGPFIEEKKDLQLAFRGSSNQRVIKMKEFFSV